MEALKPIGDIILNTSKLILPYIGGTVCTYVAILAIKILRKKSKFFRTLFENEKTVEFIMEASAKFGRGKGDINKQLKHSFVKEKLINLFGRKFGREKADAIITSCCAGLKKGLYQELLGKKNNDIQPS